VLEAVTLEVKRETISVGAEKRVDGRDEEGESERANNSRAFLPPVDRFSLLYNRGLCYVKAHFLCFFFDVVFYLSSN
jgi:hypothetical protein